MSSHQSTKDAPHGGSAKKIDQHFHSDHRKLIRTWELEKVVPLLPSGGSVLEIGAGAGWQARKLSERGFTVTAIDIAQSRYAHLQEWPVQNYDGHHIPLPDASIDCIFSSNVLEHIPHIDEFMREMRRVLKPGGVSVHVMPTTTWRVITWITFYVHRVRQIVSPQSDQESNESSSESAVPKDVRKHPRQRLQRLLLPTRHGERGTVLSEAYYFSKYYWCSTFEKNGWRVVQANGTGLLYSGYRICAERLTLVARAALSRIVGSSCRIYVTKL